MMSATLLLTLDPDGEPVAGRGWDAIAGHAQVVSHVESADLIQSEDGTLHDVELLAASQDVIPVLSPPDNVRWGVAMGVAGQTDIVALPDHHVMGLTLVDNGGRDHHLDIA